MCCGQVVGVEAQVWLAFDEEVDLEGWFFGGGWSWVCHFVFVLDFWWVVGESRFDIGFDRSMYDFVFCDADIDSSNIFFLYKVWFLGYRDGTGRLFSHDSGAQWSSAGLREGRRQSAIIGIERRDPSGVLGLVTAVGVALVYCRYGLWICFCWVYRGIYLPRYLVLLHHLHPIRFTIRKEFIRYRGHLIK